MYPGAKRANCTQGASGLVLLLGKVRGCPLCSVWPHFQHWVLVWAAQSKKDIKMFENFQRMAVKMRNGLEVKVHVEQLWSLGLLSPELRS